MRAYLLTFCSAWLLTVASAAAIGSTNADLLAQGRPLKRPARLYDASKTHNLVARASSTPTTTTTATALALIQPYTVTKKRDDIIVERDASTYLYFNSTNGKITASSTASSSFIFNDPSVHNDTIQAVIPAFTYNGREYPVQYVYMGVTPYTDQSNPTAFAWVELAPFNGNLNYPYAQTNVWEYPTAGEPATFFFTETSGDVPDLNYYVGSDSGVYGAESAAAIKAENVVVTETDRVVITLVSS